MEFSPQRSLAQNRHRRTLWHTSSYEVHSDEAVGEASSTPVAKCLCQSVRHMVCQLLVACNVEVASIAHLRRQSQGMQLCALQHLTHP